MSGIYKHAETSRRYPDEGAQKVQALGATQVDRRHLAPLNNARLRVCSFARDLFPKWTKSKEGLSGSLSFTQSPSEFNLSLDLILL